MELQVFDEVFELNKTVFIFLGKSGAGVRDLMRLKGLYPEATFFNRGETGVIKGVRLMNCSPNFVYIHSSPWNILCRIFFPLRRHFLIVHNSPNFVSRLNLAGLLDSIILKINLLIMDKFIFLSRHVEDKYNKKKYNFLLSKRSFIQTNLPVFSMNNYYPDMPTIFFFGRYLPYKNLELFYELSKKFLEYNFYIYSYGCPNFIGDNLKVNSGWISEAEVNSIYQSHQILITPYLETSQSGPFYIGLESGKIIVAPDMAGFNDYRDNENVLLYSPNNIENITFALVKALRAYDFSYGNRCK
jgi:glycosyltransferase involved in cell wall biosynthesis